MKKNILIITLFTLILSLFGCNKEPINKPSDEALKKVVGTYRLEDKMWEPFSTYPIMISLCDENIIRNDMSMEFRGCYKNWNGQFPLDYDKVLKMSTGHEPKPARNPAFVYEGKIELYLPTQVANPNIEGSKPLLDYHIVVLKYEIDDKGQIFLNHMMSEDKSYIRSNNLSNLVGYDEFEPNYSSLNLAHIERGSRNYIRIRAFTSYFDYKTNNYVNGSMVFTFNLLKDWELEE